MIMFYRNFLFFMKFFLDKNRFYHGVCVDYIETNSNEEEIKRENSLKKQITYVELCLDVNVYLN